MTKASSISWLGAAGLACALIYGPLFVMASYTQFFVPCSHCKRTAWQILPYAPGLLPVELLNHWLRLPRTSDALGFVLALAVSVAIVLMMIWLLRRRVWIRWSTFALGLIAFSALAFCILAMIRA